MHKFITSTIIFSVVLITNAVHGSYVELKSDAPIVRGANITFVATAYDDDGEFMTGTFEYDWSDNVDTSHTKHVKSQNATDSWVVSYNESGQFFAQVIVCRYMALHLFCLNVGSKSLTFNITDTFNGNLTIIQKNATRKDEFVSNSDPLLFRVQLKSTDDVFIDSAPRVLSYWFVDCVYYGIQKGLDFPFNFTKADQRHRVETVVIADFTPLPPPPTTTTTTTTIKPNVTTIAPITTTSKPTTTTSKVTTMKRIKRGVTGTSTTPPVKRSRIMQFVNGSLVPYVGDVPYACNGTVAATNSLKIYGYFSREIEVKAPVSKVNVTGNNWLQHGDLLTLNVKCQGSKNLHYCVHYVTGAYNVTGNETCDYYHQMDVCEFQIKRYFIESTQHTIIMIIENEVSKVVTPVTITVYKVTSQAQLSVIMVPVSFSLVAVVLIVFGVAYYFQNRSRFVVEVADFNFGQNYGDMEYKTFKERLRDSIANAFFTRGPSPGSSEVPVWPPGRKYGSMTS